MRPISSSGYTAVLSFHVSAGIPPKLSGHFLPTVSLQLPKLPWFINTEPQGNPTSHQCSRIAASTSVTVLARRRLERDSLTRSPHGHFFYDFIALAQVPSL
eukprot:gb/GECG01010150.1/.p1 GENE.gb/GECG01010150.1/~~gb/GECG01010150.1/.p1  ORF type:complete len:101 (+),score=5.71 gb/GECG01010150.1/:1-303(+)